MLSAVSVFFGMSLFFLLSFFVLTMIAMMLFIFWSASLFKDDSIKSALLFAIRAMLSSTVLAILMYFTSIAVQFFTV